MALDDRCDVPNLMCCLQGATAKFHNDHGELENETEEPSKDEIEDFPAPNRNLVRTVDTVAKTRLIVLKAGAFDQEENGLILGLQTQVTTYLVHWSYQIDRSNPLRSSAKS